MKDNDIKITDDNQLESLLEEALLRDANTNNVDAEWEKFKKKHPQTTASEGTNGAALEMVGTSSAADDDADTTKKGRIWRMIVAVAAVALLLFVMTWQRKGASDAIYQASDKAEEVQVLAENKEESGEIKEASGEKRVERNNSQTSNLKPQTLTVIVPNGKDHQLTLPDGTRVWMNANSRLSYPSAFKGSERRVTLQGEAYFKVTRDAAHPFVISANGITTRVLGTEFNLRSNANEATHVTLVSGKIEVSNGTIKKVLLPGQDAECTAAGALTVRNVDPQDFIQWREGIEFFDNETFKDILLGIGRWYNMNVVCNNKQLLYRHYRFFFNRNASCKEALMQLNEISGLNIVIDKNTILVQ